ncbi:MAG: sensor histidine kinase [Acidobacteriaceae bacterium]
MTLVQSKQKDIFIRSSSSPVASGRPGAMEARHLAHDVYNWLTVLQVYCGLLRTSGTVADKGQPWIEELSSAVERGRGLVDALLDSAQSSGTYPPSSAEEVTAGSTPIDLAAFLGRQLPLLREMAGNHIQIEIKTEIQSGSTALTETEFERILLNLVQNAIEAMPDGGRLRIALTRSHSPERRFLILRISDTGNGIAPEFLPHIFDSGVSTKLPSADHPRLHGFGLVIVRELTLGAGGSVRVRSRIGHGTCFTIELPLPSLPGPADPDAAASPPRKLAAVSQMQKPKSGRAGPSNNFGAHRKGTRIPC